jgi:hypothetical protein
MRGWRRIVVQSVGWLPRRAGALDTGVLHSHVGEDSAAYCLSQQGIPSPNTEPKEAHDVVRSARTLDFAFSPRSDWDRGECHLVGLSGCSLP